MSSQLSLLYVTFPSEEEAVKVTHSLLDKKLIACINILGSIKSIYRWNETIQTGEEVAALLKTTKEKASEAIAALQRVHSYDTPAILEIPIDQADVSFRHWVHESVK